MNQAPSMSSQTRVQISLALAAAIALVIARSVSAQPARPASTSATPPTAPAAAGGAAAAPTPPPAPTGRSSWTADRRQYAVGDLITVLIDDYTISTAVKDNVATDQRNRNLGVTLRIPNQGSKSAGIDSRNDAGQQQRGQQRRENRFQNEMSVRVVSVSPTGLMQIRGTKIIDIDKAKQDVVFTGVIRAQDVSSQNLIESYRVADAELRYASPGPRGQPKQGILTRVIGSIWP